MHPDSYIDEDYMVDVARLNERSDNIAHRVFNKLVKELYRSERRFIVNACPNRDKPRSRIYSPHYRLKFKVKDLVDINPNLLGSDGCIRFMIELQEKLKADISEAT